MANFNFDFDEQLETAEAKAEAPVTMLYRDPQRYDPMEDLEKLARNNVIVARVWET